MTVRAILLPVFVQIALVVALAGLMGWRRLEAVRAGSVRREDVSLGERNWPPRAQAAANAFSNQFELPVLYLALVPLAIVTRSADLLFVVLSWNFVLSRIAHAAIYATSNRIEHRFPAFAVGAAALVLMWAAFAIRILAAPLP